MSQSRQPLSIAISALGGQGGGVLAQWIVDLAEAGGYLAQSTSVPGVAQRTGTTIYSIELFPEDLAAGGQPVLDLMPAPGHVDICIAAELMEAGRAVARGLVTPERTTLIASDHRVYGITEKQALADGRKDAQHVRARLAEAARKLVLFDAHAAAEDTGSVISAVLFGALAGSGALPLPRAAFEDVIRNWAIAVESNLAGFERGFAGARDDRLAAVAEKDHAPASIDDIIELGADRLVEYQGADYAGLYLDRVRALMHRAGAPRGGPPILEAARQLALWMAYEDVIRVADLKTRSQRFADIEKEVRAAPGQIWYPHDYFHPRLQELAEIMPRRIGRWLRHSPTARRLLAPLFGKGRVISTGSLSGFLLLRLLAGLRRWRPRSLRYSEEQIAIEAWLDRIMNHVERDPALALEIARCAGLMKGYGDTHARGLAQFSQIMALVDAAAATNGLADRVSRLRAAALADDDGSALNDLLKDAA